jgi:sodium/proline symporter
MILIVPLFGYAALDNGITDISHYAHLKNISLSLIPESYEKLLSSFLVACGWGLGYFGQPHILVSFMGIKDTASVTKARTVGILWQTLTLGAALSIGLIGIAFFPEQLTNPELVFVAMVQQLFTPFFAGFVLCAIIAAGLTTVDTQILVAASIFATDIYKQLFNPQASSKKILTVSRLGIIVIPLVSLAIASTNSNSVFGLVAFAWNGLGSTFGPVLLAALYSKQAKKHAVLTGMIVGGIIAVVWPLTGSTVSAMIPAFFTNLAIILLGSLIIK